MEGLRTFVKENVRFIIFNRPERKNALTPDLYAELARILNEDAQDDDIVISVFTGTGDYFTSGNDLSISKKETEDLDEAARNAFLKFKNFIDALINYPKIIIAVVNGPAVGVGVTMLPLCDVVYASETATFHTPFISLGLRAEACSSFLFSRIMGRSRASEMLLLGRKMTANEACNCGLVSQVLASNEINALYTQILQYGNLPITSVKANKALMMKNLHNVLTETNNLECEALIEAVKQEDFSNAILAFMSRKSKL